jgi:hypothetical protein
MKSFIINYLATLLKLAHSHNLTQDLAHEFSTLIPDLNYELIKQMNSWINLKQHHLKKIKLNFIKHKNYKIRI